MLCNANSILVMEQLWDGSKDMNTATNIDENMDKNTDTNIDRVE